MNCPILDRVVFLSSSKYQEAAQGTRKKKCFLTTIIFLLFLGFFFSLTLEYTIAFLATLLPLSLSLFFLPLLEADGCCSLDALDGEGVGGRKVWKGWGAKGGRGRGTAVGSLCGARLNVWYGFTGTRVFGGFDSFYHVSEFLDLVAAFIMDGLERAKQS
ncbi:hypothetical protein F4804DRAFT_196567 [Jackrogersella minutella]|nr:hypothetical protein F4804DRAFT_196567 [Jackrogersella minutella]